MTRSHGGMNFEKMLRTFGPMAAAAVGGIIAASRKGDFKFRWDDEDWDCGTAFRNGGFGGTGVPLEELDMSGDTPRELILAGADNVVVTPGDDFTISVQGDDEVKETLRFRLEDGALHVASRNSGNGGEGIATINIIMPPPEKVTIAGAGQIAVAELADDAEVVIAGAGQISVLDLDIASLGVTIAGAGRFTAGGKVEELKLKIAGAGKAKMAGLLAEEADVHIAGAGNATFGCDGEVDARIFGAGHVTIRGSASCHVRSMGSGWVRVEPREDNDEDRGKDKAG
ncbi:head GIN domain-containing protein [Alteraurantiacibacter aquimixticola]|uniref:DUF2807 domain-containing protein n=1 Tax=Alteraurantiacibacter aquimixticola TaxID=2489173 RepID=A0A4T3EZ59_9SPHN|nr:head GIN domain-containing protein [Alteraurantiacibacter aquimixticola]TIX49159.1 DUF2807 domain-containing protein [Alteraurantiacibacter aquimixticola]